MSVDLKDMNWTLPLERINAGNVDGMVSPDHHRQRARIQYLTDSKRNILVRSDRVGVDDIRIAQIHDPHVRSQVGRIVLVVVSPCVAEGKQGRGLSYPPRSKPRTRPPLRAEIKGRPQDTGIGLDGIPILDIWLLGKGRDSHKWQVQPPCLVSMTAHRFPLSPQDVESILGISTASCVPQSAHHMRASCRAPPISLPFCAPT